MDTFSISQLSQFSGIKPHTIRIWEQRYNALRPNRSEGNTRYYDNSQLRRLLNIVSLSECGYKVSELCIMPDSSLFNLIATSNPSPNEDPAHNTAGYFIYQLVAAAMSYDEIHFEKVLAQSITKYGMQHAYTNVIYPLLERLGLMWASDTLPPAYEHFISNILRQKLFIAINALQPAKKTARTWLLFLPENELHEIGLLFANYLARRAGNKVIYLGSNVPLESVEIAVEQVAPHCLLFFLVHNGLPENVQQYCDHLSAIAKGRKVYMAASEKMMVNLQLPKKFKWVNSLETFEKQLSFIE